MAKVKVLVDSGDCFDSDDDYNLVDNGDNSHDDDVDDNNKANVESDSHGDASKVSDTDDHAVDDVSINTRSDDDESHEDSNDEDASHVSDTNDNVVDDDSDVEDEDMHTEDPSDSSSDIENGTTEISQTQNNEKSGMASVIARILSKDISKSKRVLLARGKTSLEIFKDISERKRQREELENGNVKSKHPKVEKLNDVAKEEKRKLWEAMGRRIPSILDNPREVRLRKIATQGMVQLFRLVSQAKMQG